MPVPARNDEQTIPEVIGDLKELTIAYAKQETVDPLKGLGRYIGFGIAGSVCLSIGVVVLAIAILRALQTQTDTALTGNLSWIPYLVALAFIGVVAGLAIRAISKDTRERRQDEEAT